MIERVSPSQLPGALQLVHRALDGTPYLAGALDTIRTAVGNPHPDCQALAIFERGDIGPDYPVGIVVYGFFGGARGAGRLQLVAIDPGARRARLACLLAVEAMKWLRVDHARFVLAELPDDPHALPGAREFLESLGFHQESRIENFYRDGIALSFMRKEIAAL